MKTQLLGLHSRRDAFNVSLFRVVEKLLKYMVIASDVMMTCHCFTLLTDTKLWVAEFVAGYSVMGVVALYLASYLLHFCWRYRLCLVHAFMVNCCITFEREYGFGGMLMTMRWTMFVMGIVSILLAMDACMVGIFRKGGQR